MKFLYDLGIIIIFRLAHLLVPFNPKIEAFIRGRKDLFDIAGKVNGLDDEWIWFHAASLGEFEQGRPVMEVLKKNYPRYKILLTFFSPSGYEVQKDYKGADFISYLPIDTPGNSRRFTKHFNLCLVFFIKYEFWLNYLINLKANGTPVICLAATFRPGQLFFKHWGQFYRNFLNHIDHFLVQDDQSKSLLEGIGIQNVAVSGDTRFDRVLQIESNPLVIKEIEKWAEGNNVIIFGSIWPDDMNIINPVLVALTEKGIKCLVVPHEIDQHKIMSIAVSMPVSITKYSEIKNEIPEELVIIVDRLGLLSSLYQFADIAFVGGAFRGTLHNILEPSVFGVPVLFGKLKSMKFREAVDLQNLGGAKAVGNATELLFEINLLMQNDRERKSRGRICREYVRTNSGASQKTIDLVKKYLKDHDRHSI